MGNPHRYTIEPVDPGAHLFEVTVTVAEPDPAGQTFAIAAWVPGSYLVRDLARHVVAIRAESGDDAIELTKRDKSSWQAAPCNGPLTLIAEIHARDLNVRGAHLDTQFGFYDGAGVFPSVTGQEDMPCEVEIRPPVGIDDWRLATSMRPVEAEPYGFGRFEVADYWELIDHPAQMGHLAIGEFEAGGIPHAIAVIGHAHFDMARICHDLEKVCTHHLGFLGKPADLDRYLFLLYVQRDTYGGLEHRWSSSLACSRRDLPRRGETGTGLRYRKFLGLCSHEYFHLWHVKRMKPAQFTPYDLRAEVHTSLLWVFEGVTSYYDHLGLVRSGLITSGDYLEHLGKAITRIARNPGRLRQSVAESSFDSWTRFYRQDANSVNAIVSYYTKGSLVALALDLTLRRETDGRCTLDDVMRECWARYGETGEGMPEDGLESVAREVSGAELPDFFERYVRGTTELPLAALLKDVGVTLNMRAADGDGDLGGKASGNDKPTAPWIGAGLAKRAAGSVFNNVRSGSPAERAGISPGDVAVALDDLKLDTTSLADRLREHHVGDSVVITVFRDEQLMQFKVKLASPPEDTCYLEIDADAVLDAEAARAAWLSG